jgi:Zn-dependent membrane protease YugP
MSRNMLACDVARQILNNNGLYNVVVRRTSGHLSDHYDPRNNTVNLSDSVYDSASIAAAGIAAHECGHAIQHNTAYTPVKVRTALVPVMNVAQHAWYMVFIASFILGIFQLILPAIIIFTVFALFQLVTLPVEINASARALRTLRDYHLLESDELPKARSVLTAAALTYVAALATSILQLLRFIAIYRSNDD